MPASVRTQGSLCCHERRTRHEYRGLPASIKRFSSHRPALRPLGDAPQPQIRLDSYCGPGPKQAIAEAFVWIHHPPVLDILPMYILFLLFTPLALTISRRTGWSPILAGGATLWFLAHLGLREAQHNFVNNVLRIHIPINEMGSFDLWAWQFLWSLGLWFGVRWAQGNLPVENWARRAVIPA